MTANEDFEAKAASGEEWTSNSGSRPIYEDLKSSPQSYFELRGTRNGTTHTFGKYDSLLHARAACLKFLCQIPRSEEGTWDMEYVEIPF